MRRIGQFAGVMVLIAGLCPLMLMAQDQATSRPESGVDNQEEQYVGSLNGSGLIEMGENMEQHVLLSLTGGGGWDSNPSNNYNTKSLASGVYGLSPYLGYKGSTPRSQFIVQYQPTIMRYMSTEYAQQALHRASGSLVFTESNRLKWALSADTSYGPNGARLLSTPQTVAVGDVPGTSAASSAAYLDNSGNVTYIAGSASVSYRSSDRNTIAVSGINTYSRTSGPNLAGGIANLRGTFTRDISQTLSLNGYLQGGYYYGGLRSESLGGGAGFSWQPWERTFFSFNAGPQVNTCTCGTNHIDLAYSASLGTRLTNRSQMYLLADHQPTVSFLGPSFWQRSASAGFQYHVTARGSLRVDAGYTSSDTLTAASSYRGTSWGVNYSVFLRHGLDISYSYRGYATDTSGAQTRRNLVQASITWTYRGDKTFHPGN